MCFDLTHPWSGIFKIITIGSYMTVIDQEKSQSKLYLINMDMQVKS